LLSIISAIPETAMKIDPKTAVALIAAFALYQLLGPHPEHLRGLADSVVVTELVFRAFKLDDKS
jgi:hypothetical protein